MPGYEYLAQVNLQLPEDAKVLLVGDAKAFYFRRAVDYSVVFNQNPFAHAVRSAASARDVIAWLQSRAYTHVLVNWSEVERLSATYGFSPWIDPSTFDLLVGAGLTLTRSYPHPTGGGRYVDLFQVPL